MAERLRRLTRNQLGSPRAGSSPADCEQSTFFSMFCTFRVITLFVHPNFLSALQNPLARLGPAQPLPKHPASAAGTQLHTGPCQPEWAPGATVGARRVAASEARGDSYLLSFSVAAPTHITVPAYAHMPQLHCSLTAVAGCRWRVSPGPGLRVSSGDTTCCDVH